MARPAGRSSRRAFGYSAARYLGLVDEGVLGFGDRVELLEGVIVAAEPQNPAHASAVSRIQRALERTLGDRAIIRVQLDYIAGRRSVPQPDVAVVPPDPTWYGESHPSRAWLVFEVSDSSLGPDRLTKGPIYARNGVPQYVVVNVRDDRVESFTAPDAPHRRYRAQTVLERGEHLRLAAFADVVLAVDDLLPVRRATC